jgi:type IV pilus assembly protein PilM
MTAYFGLDIGSSSIKVTQSSLMGTKAYSLDAIGLAMNPAGSVDFTNGEVVSKLGPVIRQLLSEAKIREKRVVVSVAESRVYSRILSMPVMSEAELSSAIKWEAEQFVPIPVAEVELDFSIVAQPTAASADKKMLVYLVAAPKKYVQALVTFWFRLDSSPLP